MPESQAASPQILPTAHQGHRGDAMMLHPAADSEQNPNNSKTCVGSRGGASGTVPTTVPTIIPHSAGGCHISAAPLWQQLSSHSPTFWKGAGGSTAPHSQVPLPAQDGMLWDQDGTERVSTNHSSATYQPSGFREPLPCIHSSIHPFIHSCTPSSHGWTLQ